MRRATSLPCIPRWSARPFVPPYEYVACPRCCPATPAVAHHVLCVPMQKALVLSTISNVCSVLDKAPVDTLPRTYRGTCAVLCWRRRGLCRPRNKQEQLLWFGRRGVGFMRLLIQVIIIGISLYVGLARCDAGMWHSVQRARKPSRSRHQICGNVDDTAGQQRRLLLKVGVCCTRVCRLGSGDAHPHRGGAIGGAVHCQHLRACDQRRGHGEHGRGAAGGAHAVPHTRTPGAAHVRCAMCRAAVYVL